MDLPFRAEYSKTGRAKCKSCKSPISQGVLRLATLTQVSGAPLNNLNPASLVENLWFKL